MPTEQFLSRLRSLFPAPCAPFCCAPGPTTRRAARAKSISLRRARPRARVPPGTAAAAGKARDHAWGWLEGFCDVCCLYSCLRLFSRFHVDSPILYFFFLFSFDPAPVSSVHVHTTRSPHGDPCLRCDKILPSSYYI